MTARERFLRELGSKSSEDRLPLIEWAAWWDQTIHRWEAEGLPAGLDFDDSLRYFGLDNLTCIGASCRSPRCPLERYIRLFVEYAEKAVMESASVARCRHG